MNQEKQILKLLPKDKEIKQRLLEGKRKYGKFNVHKDKRNYIKETIEEIIDALVYLAANYVKTKNKTNKKRIKTLKKVLRKLRKNE